MPMHKEHRQKWEDAGYSKYCASAEACAPPPKEYLRTYYLIPAGHAISNIALNRIKVARFADLNDPFELQAQNSRDAKVRQRLQEFKHDYDSHTGVLCFSSDWLRPVLWSHYADRHRGVCLGFNIERAFWKPKQVTYVEQRTDRSDFLKLGTTEVQDALLSRSSCTGPTRRSGASWFRWMRHKAKAATTFCRLAETLS